jgi:hypothetical protein
MVTSASRPKWTKQPICSNGEYTELADSRSFEYQSYDYPGADVHSGEQFRSWAYNAATRLPLK